MSPVKLIHDVQAMSKERFNQLSSRATKSAMAETAWSQFSISLLPESLRGLKP